MTRRRNRPSPARRVKVLVVDDHPVVRRGIKQILGEAPCVITIGEASTGREALERARQRVWDIMVLDLTLPDSDGFEILKILRREHPAVPVLVLSVHLESQFAVRALKAGAAGYLNKESAPNELIDAVHRITRGGRYLSPWLTDKLAGALGSAGPDLPHERLSDREYQVLRLIASGRTGSEIAATLAISPKTVSTYRARILDKMELQSNAQLTAYAIRHRLVE